MAEIELSVLHRQCLKARIPDKHTLMQQELGKPAAMLLHRVAFLMLASNAFIRQ